VPLADRSASLRLLSKLPHLLVAWPQSNHRFHKRITVLKFQPDGNSFLSRPFPDHPHGLELNFHFHAPIEADRRAEKYDFDF
jgi:hypothetical protein